MAGEAFWTASAEEALAQLDARPDGLSGAEAADRLARVGTNVAVGAIRQSFAARLARRLAEPLVAILLIAAFVSGATGDWRSCLVIVAIVHVSIGLDIAQERRAEAAVDALKRSVAVTARVRRDGTAAEIPAAAIAAADEAGLFFAGCAAFLDPPNASAGAAVARLAAAGVRVKIVSGDAEPVVRHLVETLGLPACGVLSGDELAGLGDAALATRAEEADLFVRVAPDQKSRIVRALRRRGHTVGYLGDGINDAPAIHAADVGLSVDGGTDVARETADIILLAPERRRPRPNRAAG